MAKQDDLDEIIAFLDEDIPEKEADIEAVIDKTLSQVRN